MQRFDPALRLNVHAQVISLDGVYVEDGAGALTFEPLPEPTAAEVLDVAERTAKRVAAAEGKVLLGDRAWPARCAIIARVPLPDEDLEPS